jgi:thiol:disulfide interchange protein DsbD
MLFAMFPGWLNSLPKSGWLNTVKVVLGFLELALAKFLSNADLVLQLHLLEEKCFWLFGLQFLEH